MKFWLTPIFIVLAIFAFVVLLINLGTTWGVTWTDMNPIIIDILPWVCALAVCLSVFVYVTRRK